MVQRILINKDVLYSPKDFQKGQLVELILEGYPKKEKTERRKGIVLENDFKRGLGLESSLKLLVNEKRHETPCSCPRDYVYNRIIKAYRIK